jgi:hypothetical protein
MNSTRRFTVTFVAAAVVVSGLATLSAHEVTHNGTVIALKTAKICADVTAQKDEKVAASLMTTSLATKRSTCGSKRRSRRAIVPE